MALAWEPPRCKQHRISRGDLQAKDASLPRVQHVSPTHANRFRWQFPPLSKLEGSLPPPSMKRVPCQSVTGPENHQHGVCAAIVPMLSVSPDLQARRGAESSWSKSKFTTPNKHAAFGTNARWFRHIDVPGLAPYREIYHAT